MDCRFWATRHITKHRHLFSDYSDQHKGEQLTIGDDSSLLVSSCGTAKIDHIEYKDVLHVPGVGTKPSLYLLHYSH